MEAKATHKAAQVAPRKARKLRPLVLGKKVAEALAILGVERRAGSVSMRKLIRSAMAQLPSELAPVAIVSEVVVDEGPKRRMYMPRARGRAAPIIKRTSHVSVRLTVPV